MDVDLSQHTDPRFPFGITCPLLLVANKYDVDYSVPLLMAHWGIHGVALPGYTEARMVAFGNMSLCDDIIKATNSMHLLRAGIYPQVDTPIPA